MGIQFGFNFTFQFQGLNQYAVQAEPAAAPGTDPAPVPAAAPSAEGATGSLPMAMGYLSPAYLMVAPQMAQMGGMAPSLFGSSMGQPGMPAAGGDSPTGSGRNSSGQESLSGKK